ncbi:response regulator transcription factor [Undibacterium jejuense]|uniref:Response regulator transcription factor n=1 Tax=Undibacterium jejuense TaxID=1344949 RepID=A0A923HIB2_9BURK|nr:LuxR C-terminal-related transcriptional regulator [Undibacterium jejuense]MBC3864249.1 response regulator transcription factor [Undibacterium jejuense]
MNEINNLLLDIYHASQNTCVSEFSDKIFSLIKREINFDSGGFCDFNTSDTSGIKLLSAAAHNISTYDKLHARQNYLEPEFVEGQNKLTSADPSLAMAFKNKGNSVTLSVYDKGIKSNVAAYGIKTECIQTMVMVLAPPMPNRFQTLSLWRRKNNAEYVQNDNCKANIIFPHVFQAFAINRQIHRISEVKNPVNGTAICSLEGALLFIDDVAEDFLFKEFHTWIPPFLPSILLENLGSTSERIYIGKMFVLTARRQKDLLFLNFRKTMTFENLSPTELVIAEMLVRNETYKAIAQKLGNQPATVRNQAHSIYSKFGISGKAELAKIINQIR